MSAYKKFNCYFATGAFLIALLPLLANYIIDPYYIFHSNFLPKEYYCNERYNKYEFIKKHIHQYDSFLFGSSRLGTTDPKIPEKYLPGSHFYNFSVSGATMFDHLQNLKFLLRQGAAIKNIYLQADIYELLTVYKYPPDNDLLRYHPETLHESALAYQFHYLKILPYDTFTGKIKQNLGLLTTKVREDFQETGCWFTDEKEAEATADPLRYVEQEPTFHQKVSRTVKANEHFQENVKDLKEFVALCQTNQIHLILFITPQNHKMLDSIDTEDYLTLLKTFAQIYPYWDFSGYNKITTDDTNYYETSHYRPFIGGYIAARIFNDATVRLDNFGHFVTPKEIHSYLEARRNEILRHDQQEKK